MERTDKVIASDGPVLHRLPPWARRELLLVLAGLVLALILAGLSCTSWLRAAEERVGDRRIRLFRHLLEARTDTFALVTLDPESMEALHLRWPVSRGVYARVLDRLQRAGAKVIAITDLLEGNGPDGLGDSALALSLRDRSNVVLASRLDAAATPPALVSLPFTAPTGYVDVPVDHGLIRDFLVVPAGAPERVHCMALEIARRYFEDDQYVPRGFAAEPGTRYRISFAGFPGTAFTRVPLQKVLGGKDVSRDVKGRVVLVGGAPGAGEAPLLTPVSTAVSDPPMTRLELVANVVYTLVTDRPLRRLPSTALFTLVFAITFLGFQVFARSPVFWSTIFVVLLGLLGGVLATGKLMFEDQYWPLGVPLAGLLVAYAAALPYRLWLQAVSLHAWVTGEDSEADMGGDRRGNGVGR